MVVIVSCRRAIGGCATMEEVIYESRIYRWLGEKLCIRSKPGLPAAAFAHPTFRGAKRYESSPNWRQKNGGLGWGPPALRKYGIGTTNGSAAQQPSRPKPGSKQPSHGFSDERNGGCESTLDDRQDVCQEGNGR